MERCLDKDIITYLALINIRVGVWTQSLSLTNCPEFQLSGVARRWESGLLGNEAVSLCDRWLEADGRVGAVLPRPAASRRARSPHPAASAGRPGGTSSPLWWGGRDSGLAHPTHALKYSTVDRHSARRVMLSHRTLQKEKLPESIRKWCLNEWHLWIYFRLYYFTTGINEHNEQLIDSAARRGKTRHSQTG